MPTNPQKHEIWLNVLKEQECSHSQFICQHHFNEQDLIQTSSKLKLKRDAVPGIFSCNNSSVENFDIEEINVGGDDRMKDDEREKFMAEIDYWKDQNELLLIKMETLMNENKELKNEIIRMESGIQKKTPSLPESTEKLNVLHCLRYGITPRQSFPEAVRKFCLSMQFHSPGGYKCLRDFFNNTLPHPSTIRAWYANSDLNIENGLSPYCLNVLKKKVDEKTAQGKKLVVALLFDEVCIKKHVQYTNCGIVGYENYFGTDPSTAKPASSVIVYMVSAVNDNFQLPIAHFFITTLNAEQKVEGLLKVARAIIETGAILCSVTFDGLVSNPSMCNKLGANLNVYADDFKPYMDIDGHQIFVIFDPSHMIKLVRNALAAKKVLFDANSNPIQWEFIRNLVKLKIENNLIIHKLTLNHINWKSNIMKVEIAVQTLSGSVTNSLNYLEGTGHRSFRNAKFTANYTDIFNDLFDAFNSKANKYKENPLKRPLSAENRDIIFELFHRAIAYISDLKFRESPGERPTNLCLSRSKTGFQGYIVSMRSTMAMYEKFVVEEKLLDSFPTMAISQDYLEIFFGRVRALNGECDNPTSQMFQSAYRKLLANTTVLYSKLGNCKIRDSLSICNPYSNILTISSRKPASLIAFNKYSETTPEEIEEVEMKVKNIEMLERKRNLTDDMQDISTSYCASMIEKKVRESEEFDCELCRTVFTENDKLPAASVWSKPETPCRSTYDICKQADHFLKLQLFKDNFRANVMCDAIMSNLNIERLYSESDFIIHPDHKLFLIKYIIQEHIRMKGVYFAKKISSELIAERVRRKFRKLIHFRNE